MTIHFHSKHFAETKLPLTEYMLLLAYEQNPDITAKDIYEAFFISERTLHRMRGALVSMGYLERTERGTYTLTNKVYSNEKAPHTPIPRRYNSKSRSV